MQVTGRICDPGVFSSAYISLTPISCLSHLTHLTHILTLTVPDKAMSEAMSEDNDKMDPNSLSHLYWPHSTYADTPMYTGKPRTVDPSDKEQQGIWQRLQTLSEKGITLKDSPESPSQFSKIGNSKDEFLLVDAHETSLYRMCKDLDDRIGRTTWFMRGKWPNFKVLAGVLSAHLDVSIDTAKRIQDSTPAHDGKEAWVHAKVTDLVEFASRLLKDVEENYE